MSSVTPAVAVASLPKRAQMNGGVALLMGITLKGSQSSRLRLERWMTVIVRCSYFVGIDVFIPGYYGSSKGEVVSLG
jgi:hypothetical protein